MLVVIGGTTASGKSALALRLARGSGGAILNADATQCYRDLPLLTARPGPQETSLAEHHLYGVLDRHQPVSAAAWLDLARPVLERLQAASRPIIVVGGTALYIKTLLQGIAEIPDVPADLRRRLRADAAPTQALHARLAAVDPVMARRLQPNDRQRVLRALEVVLATGRSLASFQEGPVRRFELPERRVGIALLPPRPLLRERIAMRLDAMLEAGLLDELRDFLEAPRALRSPLAKADGALEFAAYLRNEIAFGEARRRTLVKISRYGKRQATFFRHQLPELQPVLEPGDAPEVLALLKSMSGL